MNFSKRQSDPKSHILGISFVAAFHALLVYALVSGLGKKVIEVVRAPIETKVIEEIKKPPLPPETVVPPPPKMEAPPPPFIPPPEVQIAVPPPPPPTTITAAPTPPPPAPVEIAPVIPAPVAPAPPPAAPAPPAPPPAVAPPPPPVVVAPPTPKPMPQTLGTVCTRTSQPELPAIDVAVNATILVRYTIQAGKVTKMDVIKESYVPNIDRKAKRALLAAIEAAAMAYGCTGDHTDITQEFVFKLN